MSGAEPPEGEEMKYITRQVKYLKEVVVAKDPSVVHVFDIVEHGRRFYRTLVFSSDASLSLVSHPPVGVREEVNLVETMVKIFVMSDRNYERPPL